MILNLVSALTVAWISILTEHSFLPVSAFFESHLVFAEFEAAVPASPRPTVA